MRAIDIVGERFGHLTVLEHVPPPSRKGRTLCICRCDCGTETIVSVDHLRSGHTQSCGCLKKKARLKPQQVTCPVCGIDFEPFSRKTKFCSEACSHRGNSAYVHGRSFSREHRSWTHAKGRSFNPNAPNFPGWGGRGITMCDRWRDSFATFFADMGSCPPGCVLDRIDNDGPYSPENCRWATLSESMTNRRNVPLVTVDGVTLPLPEWGRRNGLTSATIYARIKRLGWSPAEAVTVPTFSSWERGEQHRSAKLTAAQVLKIRSEYAVGRITKAALARKYAISDRTISDVVNRKKWRHI